MKIQIPEVYSPLFLPKRYKVLEGGRGSAKSESVARWLLIEALQHKERILCTRELQNSIADSVHKTLSDIIDQYKLPHYKVFDSYIQNKDTGSEFIFKGIRHNTTEIKSMKGITKAWCEESHSLTKDSLDVLIPTIREENSEIIFTFNRMLDLDPVYEMFCVEDRDDVWKVHTTYRDNPFFPEVLRREMERCREFTPNDYMHIWEGGPKRAGGNTFNTDWFKWTSDIPPEKEFDFRFITADTAYKEKQEFGTKANPKRDPDYHVFSYWGVKDKRLYWLDLIRKQMKALDVEGWCTPWILPKITNGFRYVWIEDKGHGIYLNQKFRSEGKIHVPDEAMLKEVMTRKADKVERANNSIAWIDKVNNNVIINTGMGDDKIKTIKEELVFFPNGIHDDICFVGDTKVATLFGLKKIKDIKKGEYVITPFGLSKVLQANYTGIHKVITNIGLTGTPHHKIFSSDTFIDLIDVNPNDIDYLSLGGFLKWRYQKRLSLMAGHTGLWGREDIIFLNQQRMKVESVLKDFILRFGNFIIKKKYLKALSFIIGMATYLIMTFLIWNVFRGSDIMKSIINLIMIEGVRLNNLNISTISEDRQKSGINLMKEENGTDLILKNNGNTPKHIKRTVHFVGRNLKLFTKILFFAVKIAGRKIKGEPINAQLKEYAKNAEKSLRFYESWNGRPVSNVAREAEAVYNIKTSHGVFYANGVLVSNCDTLIDGVIIGLAVKDYAAELNKFLYGR